MNDLWFLLEVRAVRHPKLVRAGVDAFVLWCGGLAYSREMSTDGRIPDDVVDTLTPMVKGSRARKAAAALVREGSWHRIDGGYLIHDIEEHQTSAAAIEKKRADARRRAKAWRDRHALRDANDTRSAPAPNAHSAPPHNTEQKTQEQQQLSSVSSDPPPAATAAAASGSPQNPRSQPDVAELADEIVRTIPGFKQLDAEKLCNPENVAEVRRQLDAWPSRKVDEIGNPAAYFVSAVRGKFTVPTGRPTPKSDSFGLPAFTPEDEARNEAIRDELLARRAQETA